MTTAKYIIIRTDGNNEYIVYDEPGKDARAAMSECLDRIKDGEKVRLLRKSISDGLVWEVPTEDILATENNERGFVLGNIRDEMLQEASSNPNWNY